MAKASKDTTTQTDETAVEKRVDAMMDPRAAEAVETVPETVALELPPLDIYAEPSSAPPLSEELLKSKKSDASHEQPPVETTLEVSQVQELADAEPQLEATEAVAEAAPAEITIKPLNIDTPQSDDAIDDIVAQEADAVLAAEDANIADNAEDVEASMADEPTKHGHPIFWFIIFMLAILCLIAAFVVTNPNVSLPFSA